MTTHHPESKGRLAILSLGALGVVYGDIGTSPLYAFRESFVAARDLTVDKPAVMGILSLMFWSLIIIVTIKYLMIVMRADNDGEGGILALTSLVMRGSNFVETGRRKAIIGLGLFGTALLYGDGIITPAISVLAAVEGLEIARPELHTWVVPIAVGILIALFLIQRRGTATIGAVFGPIMILWFSILAALGIFEIVAHPSILAALSPSYAVQFIAGRPSAAFFSLGAIFLVVTGSEALYADMGHFGRRAIRLGWFAVVLPALVLNYFGQGALLIADPSAIDSPFFRMPPSWAVVPLIVVSAAATVIASQALISGAFSLTMQAVQLGYLPRMQIDHTSSKEIGQVYVPVVNNALMAACVLLVVTFKSSTNLAAAYGIAVTTTMIITTALLSLVMRERWGWSRSKVLAFIIPLGLIDLLFLSANAIKILAGGWVPLTIGAAVFAMMVTWKKGRLLMSDRLKVEELPIERFVRSIAAHPQPRVRGTAIYLVREIGATPPALLTNLRHNNMLHDQVVILTVLTSRVPKVPQARRERVRPLGEGFFQIDLNFGFAEQPDVPAALDAIVSSEFGVDLDDVVYILGRESVVSTEAPGMARWRERLFALMHRNAGSPVRHFLLPHDLVMEVGSHVAI
jgi:KUP system potassium uptake protein